jgi:hypothetical protein
MRATRVLVIFGAFAFAGVTNVLMVQAGTYTDGKGAGVLVVAIAAMTVGLHRLDRRSRAPTSGGNN